MSSDQPEDIAVQQPLLASPREENASRNNQGTFTRNLGAAEAFGIVVSIVIGSGVFTSPGSIDTNVPSPGIALAIWLIGGVLAWTGATTFAELGTAIQGEGEISLLKLELMGSNVVQVVCSHTFSTSMAKSGVFSQHGHGSSLSCPQPSPFSALSSSRAHTQLLA